MATAKKKQEERAEQMDSGDDDGSDDGGIEPFEYDNNNIKTDSIPSIDASSLYPHLHPQWSPMTSSNESDVTLRDAVLVMLRSREVNADGRVRRGDGKEVFVGHGT